MVQLAVTGATGRMGGAVLEAATDREDCAVSLAVSPSPGGEVRGVPVEPATDLSALLADRRPDVVVDFTTPTATREAAAACAEAGVGLVTGTTGLGTAGREALEAAAADVPVLHAPNFSRGVAALVRALEAAVAALPDYDVEVLEVHHSGKVDAPSGTAGRLLETIDPDGETDLTHGREGEAPRSQAEVGVHAVRAGDITGEHTVLLAGNREELRLTHRAEDRAVFAAGALDAAVLIAGREAGTYSFSEVVGR